MLDCTTREHRALMRILSKRLVLWTEMVVDETITFTAHDPILLAPHLHMESTEQPVICQIGGIDAQYTTVATQLIEQYQEA